MSAALPLRTILLGLALSAAANAQATYSVAVDRARVTVGEPFEIVLTVENARSVGPPQLDAPPELDVSLPSRMSRHQIVNGRSSSSEVYTFQARGRRPGRVTIPPIEFELDGRPVRTQAQQVEIVAAAPEARGGTDEVLLRAEIRCDEPRLFVGQRARFQLLVWIKPAVVSGYRISSSDMLNLFGASARLGVFGSDVGWGARQLQLEDGSYAEYHCLVSDADVVLTEPGPPRFDGLYIGFDYPTAIGRNVFRQLQIRDSRNVSVQPQILAPEVEPLPEQNRPDNFSGAVGQFGIVATLTEPRRRYRVGDPIELSLVISGSGDMETLPGPRLDRQPELTADFRIGTDVLAGTAVRDRKIFRQTVRPRHAGIEAVPPIEYAYFDPRQARYAVAASSAIPVTVEESETIAAEDLADIAGPASAPTELAALDGLRGNVTDEAALLASAAPPSRTGVVAAVAGPPVGFLLVWGALSLRTGGDARGLRRRRALQTARHRLRDAHALTGPDLTRAVASALVGYLADRLDEPPARLTGRGALDVLRARNAADGTISEVARLLGRCEAETYAGAAGNGDRALVEQADDCLQRLARERL